MTISWTSAKIPVCPCPDLPNESNAVKPFDIAHPVFLPLWRRIVTVGVVGGWSLFELWNGNSGWAVIFAVIALYCAYEFFIAFDPKAYAAKNAENTNDNNKDHGNG